MTQTTVKLLKLPGKLLKELTRSNLYPVTVSALKEETFSEVQFFLKTELPTVPTEKEKNRNFTVGTKIFQTRRSGHYIMQRKTYGNLTKKFLIAEHWCLTEEKSTPTSIFQATDTENSIADGKKAWNLIWQMKWKMT